MYYYIWKDEHGNISAYMESKIPKSPPAIEVSLEEFKFLGFYSQDSIEDKATKENE